MLSTKLGLHFFRWTTYPSLNVMPAPLPSLSSVDHKQALQDYQRHNKQYKRSFDLVLQVIPISAVTLLSNECFNQIVSLFRATLLKHYPYCLIISSSWILASHGWLFQILVPSISFFSV